VPLEGVTTLYDIQDELKDFVKNGFKPGFQIGLKNFDNIFSTYTGQFITVTGIPSSGKSDFVDQMVVGYNKNYEWKTAFASPENQPTYLHAHKLMRKTWQDMPSAGDIGGDKWNQVADHGLLVHRDYENKTTKVKVLKVKFQNLGENGGESFFTWEPRSGSFIPEAVIETENMPWE